jgi:hypothetical protein
VKYVNYKILNGDVRAKDEISNNVKHIIQFYPMDMKRMM